MRTIAAVISVCLATATYAAGDGRDAILLMKGSPEAAGRVHGEHYRVQIQSAVSQLQTRLESDPAFARQIDAATRELVSVLPESKRAEIDAIAGGAKTDGDLLLKRHAYWLSRIRIGSHGAAFGERTVGGRLHHVLFADPATNVGPIDDAMSAGLDVRLLGMRIPAVGHAYVVASPPGIALLSGGMNRQGIVVTLAPDERTSIAHMVRASAVAEETLQKHGSLFPAMSGLAAATGVSVFVSDGKIPDGRLLHPNGSANWIGPGEPTTNGRIQSDSNALFYSNEDCDPVAPDGQASLSPQTLLKSGSGGSTLAFSASELEVWHADRKGEVRRFRWTEQDGRQTLEPVPVVSDAGLVRIAIRPNGSEMQIPEMFRMNIEPFEVEMEAESVAGGVLRSKVRFPSPVQTAHPENNTVHAEYFRPFGAGPYPCVIVLHIAGGDFELSRFMARMLTYGDVAALFIKMPYYGERRPKEGRIRMISNDLERGLTSMRQVVLDIRRSCDWIQELPELDGGRIGIAGISLGSITGSLAAAIEPRITHACLIMGGAHLQHVLYESSEREAKEYRQAWAEAGGTRETFAEVFAPFDAATYADRLRERTVFMISAREDEVIPMKSTLALWEAAGKQKIVWYPCGHYTMAKYLLPALGHTVRFFQQWPQGPLVEGDVGR